ncbi:MAG: flagellar hook-length control protein FliK [Alphaproteobacteria bacterium]|nr:flagellar hook-length control protein FliK [Alphaproteobacteria bacterium]
MVVELNSIRNTKSAELSGSIATLKNCVTADRQKGVLKTNSFQMHLKKPIEKTPYLEKAPDSSAHSTIRTKCNNSADEGRLRMASKSSAQKSMKGSSDVRKSDIKSEILKDYSQEELQLPKAEASHDLSLEEFFDDMDGVDAAGYLADSDESDLDPQLSWFKYSTDSKEMPELLLEESYEISQAQHSANENSIISSNNTKDIGQGHVIFAPQEIEQEQLALAPKTHIMKTNSTPTPDPYAKGLYASDTRMGELSFPRIQMQSSLEGENTMTTVQMDLISSELVSLQYSRERPELMSRGRSDSGIDLLSKEGLEIVSSKISEENSPRRMEESDVTLFVEEEVDSATLDSTPLESLSKRIPQQGDDFVGALDDQDMLKMPNKTDGSIALQMNALNQRGDAPLSIAPLRQVALQLTKALETRVNHLTFQLDPEHLGKVDVELKIMNDNYVQAIFHVDNPESYELLRKDSAELQALLSEAGFESSADDFSFNYRDPHSESGEKESPFLSSARTRQHEIQESAIEGSLDVQSSFRRSDSSKTLDTLI